MSSILKINRTTIIIFLILGTPLAIVIYIASMNYSGYCFAKNRYLANEEKIEIVFNYQNRRTQLPVNGIDGYVNSLIPYKNYEEFAKENPNCCGVNLDGSYDVPPSSFVNRITGYDSGDIIILNYKVKYFSYDDKKKTGTNQFVNQLTNCGLVRD